MTQWEASMAQQQQVGLAQLQNMLSGQGLGVWQNISAGTSNAVTQYVPYAVAPAPAKPKADGPAEFAWLRQRVEEICWKAA